MNNETEIPKQTCPECGYEMDCTSAAVGNAKPQPGDLSMCLACGAASVFTEDLHMRKPTPEEAVKMASHPVLIQAQLVRAGIVGDQIKNRRNQ